MRKRFPTADELVSDNYSFFVIGYCTTERPSDGMDWSELLPQVNPP
jgi:hypothetical protein